MRKLMFLLCLSVASGLVAIDFNDVSRGHWAKPSIDRVVGMGILAGYEDDTFRGNSTVNRYEFAIFVDNLLKVMDRRYASKQSQDAVIRQFDAFVESYESDKNKYYRVTKEEWQALLKDVEYLRAEVTELRKQVKDSAKP